MVLMILGVGFLAAIAALIILRVRPSAICKLTLREGKTAGLDFPIFDHAATIGSEEGQTVVISHPKVSRNHAVLTFEDDAFVLRDESKHGIRINGKPCKEAVLRSGDLIRLGESIDLIFTRMT